VRASQVPGILTIKVQEFLCNLWNLHLDYKQLKKDTYTLTIDFERFHTCERKNSYLQQPSIFFTCKFYTQKFKKFVHIIVNILIDLFQYSMNFHIFNIFLTTSYLIYKAVKNFTAFMKHVYIFK